MRQQEKKKKKEDVEVLEQFWGKEGDLDEKDKFLRKFILEKGWIDRVEVGKMTEDQKMID